jgi:hypothetical protein
MLLKFWKNNNDIILESDKYELLDITKDFRTRFLNKDEMTNNTYKIEDNVYFLRKDFFINMAKVQNRKSIESLLIRYNNSKIIIVSGKCCVYYNGKPITIFDYNTELDECKGMNIANISSSIIENELL